MVFPKSRFSKRAVRVILLFKSSRRRSISPGTTWISQKESSVRVLPSGKKISWCFNFSGELSAKSVKRRRIRRICSPSWTEPICNPPVIASWAGLGSITSVAWQRGIPPMYAVSCSWKSVSEIPNCDNFSRSGKKTREAPAGIRPLSISTTPGICCIIPSAWEAICCRAT